MDQALMKRLCHPCEPVDVILDTDAYNEIDDQFAIAYLLRSSECAHVRALCAAPFYAFFNPRSTSAGDGMERSYQEILRLLDIAGCSALKPYAFRGAERFLPDEKTPVESPAALEIVRTAMTYTAEKPLYILSIGAITNVASALLLEPDIRERIVIIWLGGHAPHWPDTVEFNLLQDVAAARVVFDSGAALVQVPCNGVADALKTTKPELNAWLRGKNALCDYLCDNAITEAESYAAGKPWSRVIWDVSAVAWLLDKNGDMTKDSLVPAPIPQYDFHYSFDPRRHLIRQVWQIDRDKVFEDLFRRLSNQ